MGPNSHKTVQAFFHLVEHLPPIRSKLEGTMSKAAYQSYIKNLRRIADSVESLQPAIASGGSGINAEYPWMGPNGVVAPADYAFRAVSNPDEADLRRFLGVLLEVADSR
ncbi:hypothetical protein BH11ARM2_BH11ARM2_36730 [soil metagenome]